MIRRKRSSLRYSFRLKSIGVVKFERVDSVVCR